MFEWRHIAGLKVRDFRRGITAFAEQCKAHSPAYAVIDAAALDQGSSAVAWLRGQPVDGEVEEYQTWWMRDIVPAYHDAGIACLAVGTGHAGAPGDLPAIPGVRFKIGYFPDVDTALGWKPGK